MTEDAPNLAPLPRVVRSGGLFGILLLGHVLLASACTSETEARLSGTAPSL